MEISAIISYIEHEQFALPEFQRGYVWGREDVRRLFDSLYRRYPVGGFLVWMTQPDPETLRGSGASSGLRSSCCWTASRERRRCTE